MTDSPEIALIHRAWQARTERDLQAFERAFAPDAQWRGVEEGPWNCEGREAILEVMEHNLPRGLTGQVEETTQQGSRVLVGFRPDNLTPGTGPLDQGIAYTVVTVRDGEIVEMKGCADRAGAMAYVNASWGVPASTVAPRLPPTETPIPSMTFAGGRSLACRLDAGAICS